MQYRAVVMSVEYGDKSFEWANMEPVGNTPDDIEFHKNKSSWCCSNIYTSSSYKMRPPPPDFPNLADSEDDCLCFKINFRYLRDADDQDMQHFRVREWPEYLEVVK